MDKDMNNSAAAAATAAAAPAREAPEVPSGGSSASASSSSNDTVHDSALSSAAAHTSASANERTQMQKKTFTRWANSYLAKRGLQVQDVSTDFSDGILLINLLELLSSERMSRHNKNPKMEIQKLENLNTCLDFIKSHDIKLINIGSKDIYSGSEKLILGLLWTLILRWEVTAEDGKAGLLLWVQRCCRGYSGIDPPNVENFTSSWCSGLPFCALIHKFRPDLLDYNSLNPQDAMKNCELAFSVAEKELGITPLLDPGDVVQAPDEKSVIAYVSQFFKLFAQASKNDALIKSIKNAVEVTKRHDDWIQQYNQEAAEIKEWIDTQNSHFSAPDNSSSTADVKAKVDAFSTHMSQAKPEWQSKLASAEGVYNTLSNSKKNNKRPEFQPEIDLDQLNKSWEELQQAEQAYEQAMLEKYQRFQQIDHMASKFNSRVGTVESWLQDRMAQFESPDLGATLTDIERNLEMHSSFEARLGQYDTILQEMQSTAEEIDQMSQGEHAAGDAAKEKVKAIRASFEDVKQKGEAYKQSLQEALEREKHFLELERKFLQAADTLDFDLNHIEELANEEVVVVSLKEVEALKKTCQEARNRLQGCESKIEELNSLASELERKPEFKTTVQNEQARLSDIKSKIDQRDETLSQLLDVEQKKEELRKKFAEKANEFNKNCEKQKAALLVSGTLEQQLEAVKQARAEITRLADEPLKELESLASECDNYQMIGNPHTPHTIHTLRAMVDQLVKSCNNTESSINSQIMAKKALEVSPEQLREIEEVFAYFDADKSGYLDIKELKEACTGAGIDLDEEEIERRAYEANAQGEMDLTTFTQFMLEQMKTGDTKDDIVSAFHKLSGDSKISQDQIADTLKSEPELKDYILERIVDGDYESFASDLFSR